MATIDDEFSDDADKLNAIIDLIDIHCHLKHSKEDPAENHPAVDYLGQNFGNESSTDMGHAISDTAVDMSIRIPICQECTEALLSEDWVLLYCTHCNSSQWICKKYSQRMYPFWLHIKWMDECPICYKVKNIVTDTP